MWNNVPNATIALATVLTLGLVAPNDERRDPVPTEQVELIDATEEFADLASWAVNLFD
ncbi:hypothetical protein [Ilumatobacter sp.]|uniref:hypothetical protein n=1 Tax=Ilumatobacter sp. TaxID=1967498 RepID=UPI003C5B09F7